MILIYIVIILIYYYNFNIYCYNFNIYCYNFNIYWDNFNIYCYNFNIYWDNFRGWVSIINMSARLILSYPPRYSCIPESCLVKQNLLKYLYK